MTDDERAFIRRIADEPDDDTPRLVFADWLEESGDPVMMARAEFLRQDIAYHRMADSNPQKDRMRQQNYSMLWSNALAWWNELPKIHGITWGWFMRGCVESVQGRSDAFMENIETIFDSAPIRTVGLAFVTSELVIRLANSKEIGKVETLSLHPSTQGSRAPSRRNNNYLLSDSAAAALADSPFLQRLKRLKVSSPSRTSTLPGWSKFVRRFGAIAHSI